MPAGGNHLGNSNVHGEAAGIPRTGSELSQEGCSWRRRYRGLRGGSARILAGVGPLDPICRILTPTAPSAAQAPLLAEGMGAHLVYLHCCGAGIRGQVRPFQIKCPERETEMG